MPLALDKNVFLFLLFCIHKVFTKRAKWRKQALIEWIEMDGLFGWVLAKVYIIVYWSTSRSECANEVKNMLSYRHIARYSFYFLLILFKALSKDPDTFWL